VADTLRDLRPSRIGHGVSAAQDPRLMEALAERGTVLEVCPGSNVFLGSQTRTWKGHPIEKLRKAGVKVTVSTDDPPFFGITMTSDYENLERTFGWDEEMFRDLNKVALQAAFCDAATKERIAKRLEGQA
jgi:adenosine deaminase